ncbi:lysine transporter LysE [Chromobacterium phragmitis]|uniref:Lysine transporter LysE n=2 Tax=Chromobacterium phragmitis TaxID=2202141 RepID=A0A344UMF2_9NEIS|nr:LysE family translocator [Chromobacterium phragmitis]AXE31064.1 lysine transporter LysE [Chromobacterium phragmitis]AXE36450.1 lysine transporter LysE [Chromobacterium phragmitis]
MDVGGMDANTAAAFAVYLVGAASPGPSNLAIMGVAMEQGRGKGLALAAGVVLGSVCWGVLAALGAAELMRGSLALAWAMKLFGGAYLLLLAWRALGQVRAREAVAADGLLPMTHGQAFRRGILMHLGNPKAILVWLSLVSLASPAAGGTVHGAWVVAGCAGIAVCVFSAYALLFSTVAARRAYLRLRRWLHGALALAFGYAGLRMLLGKA